MKLTMKNNTDVYDATAVQILPLLDESGEELCLVAYKLSPLSNADFKRIEEANSAAVKKFSKTEVKRFSSNFEILATVFDEKVIARLHAEEDENWKTAVSFEEKVEAIQGLLFCKVKEPKKSLNILKNKREFKVTLESFFCDEAKYEEFIKNAEEFLEDDNFYSSLIVETEHFFRLPTKAEIDEYTAIIAQTPSVIHLASTAKTPAERLLHLYELTNLKTLGYVKNEIPDWHKIKAVTSFFLKRTRKQVRFST